MSISLNILDMNGFELNELNFGLLERGEKSRPLKFKIINTGLVNLKNLRIRPVMAYLQQGDIIDTVNSTYISVDGVNYLNKVNINLKIDEEKIIYIIWQPRWNCRIMQYHWALEFDLLGPTVENVCP